MPAQTRQDLGHGAPVNGVFLQPLIKGGHEDGGPRVGEKLVDHGLRDQANAAFRSPETLSVKFRVFAHNQTLGDFNISVDDDISQARGAADIDAGKDDRVLHVCKRIHPRAR